MEQPTQETKPVLPEKKEQKPADFKLLFLSSSGNFLVEDTPNYRLEADHARKLISLTLHNTWQNFSAVPTLETHLRNIAGALVGEFAFLIDHSALRPDSDGAIQVPAIPNRGALYNAGLVKVADVIPHDCNELVHGTHSFSVNAVKMRSFTSRRHAENWLSLDH